MRELVVIVGSSVLLLPSPPPNQTPSHHFTTKHNKPSLFNPTKHSPAKLSCFPLDSTTTTTTTISRPPLLMNVRWNLNRRYESHLKYYANLASKLAEDGRLEDFLIMAESVLASGVEPSKFTDSLSIKTVSSGISEVIRKGKLETVIRFLSKVEKLGICAAKLFDGSAKKLLGGQCRRLVDVAELEQVVDMMEVFAGFHFSIKELVDPIHVLKLCVEKRNPNMAIRYACIFPHAHTLYGSIIREFGKQRDLVSALAAYEASKCKSDGPPNMYACRTIIDVCGLCGDYIKSRYIYEELLAQKVTPNTYVFNSLMNVNAHDLSYTLHVYKHMQNLGVTVDMASYNILLKACCLAGRVDLTQDIYREVKHLESKRVLKMDVFTYSTIIKIFADAKMWHMAIKIKEDMLSAGVTPNMITWSSLISACANVGLVEQAILVFEEMLLTGCEPNAQCCNILLHACVEACQYDRAFRIFQSWKKSGLQKAHPRRDGNSDDLLRLCADHTSENLIAPVPSHINDLYHLSFAKVVTFTPTTTTYNILMKACGTDYHRAKALMDEMKTAGLSPNHISWSILIDICGGSGNVKGAMQALRTMRDAGIKLDVVAYTTAIKACVENKNLKLAFSLFEEMKRYQIQPNLVTYNTLLRARSKYGSLHEVQQCLGIYQDMRKSGYKSNDYFLKELIEEWCEGVIQDNNQNQRLLAQGNSCNKYKVERSHSLLLEKIAIHLQKDISESLAIDLRGLSKVEARIIVLAVLQMIRESYTPGLPVENDIVILLGVRKGGSAAKHESVVQDAVIKLLQHELGLHVVLTGITVERNDMRSSLNAESSRENLGNNRMSLELESSTRRPAVLRRLTVTKKSLHHWLQRRVGSIRR